MPQATTFDIPDNSEQRSSAAIVAALQEMLDALLSAHSGTTAPSYKEVGTIWRDTANNVLKVWNGSTWESQATQSWVTTQIDNLIASAPGALNTLDELAAALGDDANFAATVTAALGNRVRFDAAQSLSTGEKIQARSNIGAGTSDIAAATQAEMEAAASTNVAVSPGRIVHDPAHLKAGIAFYWSLSTHSTISSVNTTTDEVTTAGAHTLSTGDCVCCDPSGPGGWGNRVFYFARVVSSTVFTLHPTYTDAVNNTNKIDLTSAGSSTRNIYRFDATVLWSYRGAASAVITAKPGAAWNTAAVSSVAPGIGQVRFSFANALSSATAAFAQTSSLLGGSLDSGTTWYKSGIFLRPSAVTATTYLDWDMTAYYDSNVMLITTSGSSYVYVALVYGDE